MDSIVELDSAELSAAATSLTWTGLAPGYTLTDEKAGLLLSYCGGLASAATWVVCDVGRWKRSELRRRFTVGTDAYNEAVGNLYRKLSDFLPSVSSPISWRSYLNVGDAVNYNDRVEGFGPAVYLPALTLEPDAFASFVLAVQEGTHKTFLTQLYGQHNKLLAPTASSNGYGPHDDNDVPFSASGPGVQAEASEWVENYERESGPYPDSQVDAELMREVAYLLRHYAWKYCRGEQGLPYIEEEKEFWEGEAHRCAVAIDRVNELIAMN